MSELFCITCEWMPDDLAKMSETFGVEAALELLGCSDIGVIERDPGTDGAHRLIEGTLEAPSYANVFLKLAASPEIADLEPCFQISVLREIAEPPQ